MIIVSCTKTVEYPITSDQRKPVVYAFINQNEIFVNLFWSRLVTDSINGANIDNASIILFESEDFIGNLNNIGDGKYKFEHLQINENSEYRIVVSIPNYGNVEAKTTMPENIETEFSFGVEDNSTDIIINQKFIDPANKSNYYYTNIKTIIYFSNNVIDTTIILNFNSPMYQNLYGGNGSIFHDRMIDGQNFNCRININQYGFKIRDRENDTTYYCDSALIIPQLHAINYYTYQFYSDIYTQDYNNSNLFSEPYLVHSNIENAYGIFGAYYQQTDTLVYLVEF